MLVHFLFFYKTAICAISSTICVNTYIRISGEFKFSVFELKSMNAILLAIQENPFNYIKFTNENLIAITLMTGKYEYNQCE